MWSAWPGNAFTAAVENVVPGNLTFALQESASGVTRPAGIDPRLVKGILSQVHSVLGLRDYMLGPLVGFVALFYQE